MPSRVFYNSTDVFMVWVAHLMFVSKELWPHYCFYITTTSTVKRKEKTMFYICFFQISTFLNDAKEHHSSNSKNYNSKKKQVQSLNHCHNQLQFSIDRIYGNIIFTLIHVWFCRSTCFQLMLEKCGMMVNYIYVELLMVSRSTAHGVNPGEKANLSVEEFQSIEEKEWLTKWGSSRHVQIPCCKWLPSSTMNLEHVVESCRFMLKRETTVKSWGDQWSMFVWGSWRSLRWKKSWSSGTEGGQLFCCLLLWVTQWSFSQRLPWRDDYIMAVLSWAPAERQSVELA